jgi:hypothetical protein
MTPVFSNSILWEFDVATSTSAGLLLDSSTALRTPSNYQFISGLRITNTDTANSVYLGSNSNLSATKFWRILGPLSSLEDTDVFMGKGAASQLYVLASAGTPSIHVEAIQ